MDEEEKERERGREGERGSYKVLSVGMVQVFGKVPPRRGFSLMSLYKARGERKRERKNEIVQKIEKEGTKEVKKERGEVQVADVG